MEEPGKSFALKSAIWRFGAKVVKASRDERVLQAIGWRMLKLTPLYRAVLLRRVVFIGITGSCGKTTAKELIAAVLATKFKGKTNPASFNVPPHLDRTIARVRPWDDYCLLELAPTKNGIPVFDEVLRRVRPQVGVVTVIGTDHIKTFRSIEAIAAEKGKLVASLPVNGMAVLNFDDPHVRKMQSICAAKAITYGVAGDAMLRAEDIRAAWPNCLSFTVRHEGASVPVRTLLYGAHVVSSVLAAVAVGLSMGVPLTTAAEAVGTVPPIGRRMNPVHHPDGFTFIRDDFKAPLWSIAATLVFMKEARAVRKVLVIGTISDTRGTSDAAYVTTARQALEIADLVLFVGRNSSKCLKAKRPQSAEALQAFYSPAAAGRFLRGWLRSGDLVLLKGSEVDCLDVVVADASQTKGASAPDWTIPASNEPSDRCQIVVGLGNTGARYDDTPHNAGYRALDLLAHSLGATWTREENAMVAHIERANGGICLLKLLAPVNMTGPMLALMGGRLGFRSAQCILVHDDMDVPIGSTRMCVRAGDAGHRGVRSVLEAFQTDDVRRIRIGIGRPGQGKQTKEFVVTASSPDERSILDGACAAAAKQVLELLGQREDGSPSNTAAMMNAWHQRGEGG